MPNQTIALLHPGDMGAAIAACLVGRGCRVVWASEGRGPATRARAEAAGLEDFGSLNRGLAQSDIALSVCPPHGALELARRAMASGYRGIYVDANAISPASARNIGRQIEAAGASFVDGGIVGPPPVPGALARLYLAGPRAPEVASLFENTRLRAITLEEPAGAASALKACYAAWTKGATALLACIRALARHEGVEAALLEEWKLSQPDLPRRSEAVTASARKAWRWTAEMDEIAATFAAAGLPSGFHRASAELYRRLEEFKDRAPADLTEVIGAIRRAGGS